MTRMKESGIEWIGQIPEEWGISNLKYVVTEITDIDHYMPESKDEGIPYLMTGDLQPVISQIDFNKVKKISEEDYVKLSRKIKPQIGDIIFARYASIGNSSFVDVNFKFLVSYSCLTIRPNEKLMMGRFLYHYLNSQSFQIEMESFSNANTQANVGLESLRVANIILPPLNEQTKIADLLDKKVAQLDQAKSLLEEQIQKLEDYRQSLIYETVTKGLDKTAPMKDSGVDWIGQVPEGWGVKPLKYIISFQNGYAFESIDLTDEDTGINVIRIGDFKPSGIDFEFALKYSGNDIDKLEQYKIKNGQILLAMSGATVGKISYVQNISDNISYINQRVGIIESIFNKFIYFILSTSSFIEFIMLNSNGSAQPNISSNQVGEFKIPLPSHSEVVQIADFLDKKVSQINQLIAIKQQQIANINQQRQTLIYDYVTGKRRV